MTLRLCTFGLLATAALATAGCSRGGPERFALGGQVTLDGAPIPDGEIMFRPTAETRGPTATGHVENGAYEIPSERGAVAGAYSVSITAERPTGRKVRADILGSATTDQFEQYLPPRYNAQTTLEATIDRDRDDLNFELTSDKRTR